MRARQAQALQLAMDLGALLPLESSASLCLSDVSGLMRALSRSPPF
jgi:hypothetical protein